jgi:hypothetical protein
MASKNYKPSCKTIKIAMGSVRAAHFTGPLDTAASSFYDLYNRLAQKFGNRIIQKGKGECVRLLFDYFNAVPSNQKPKADLKVLEEADVFIVVLENEFQYATNKVNPVYRQYLDDRLEKIRDTLKGKTVIVLNSDVQHNPELITNYTFKDVPLKDLLWIEENDVHGNYHTLKYYNLVNHLSRNRLKEPKRYDFAYWGSYRQDSPERQQVLTGLRKQYTDIDTFYLGHLPPFTDQKWTRKFVEAVPVLQAARCTLCFGTDENPNWLTAKYHEAMGMGIIPFVWTNYDVDGTFNEISWQIVGSTEELAEKIYEIRDPQRWKTYWTQIESSYKKAILSESELVKEWENTILPMLIS